MLRRIVLVMLAANAAAERSIETALPDFRAARAGLLDGRMHAANDYGEVTIERDGADVKAFTAQFKHPRRGPTVERCTVLKDTRALFELRVDVRSPAVEGGDRFETRIDVSVARTADGASLSAKSTVRWLDKAWPYSDRWIASRVERAAERGSVDAYGAYAAALAADGGRSSPAPRAAGGLLSMANRWRGGAADAYGASDDDTLDDGAAAAWAATPGNTTDPHSQKRVFGGAVALVTVVALLKGEAADRLRRYGGAALALAALRGFVEGGGFGTSSLPHRH